MIDKRMTDRLEIRGLEVFAHHGVLDFERRDGQVFRFDIVLGLDTSEAARTDDLSKTVDYGEVVGDVVRSVGKDPVDLIETLAQRVGDVCLSREQVSWVEVTVHKPHAPIDATFTDVALTITRSKQ